MRHYLVSGVALVLVIAACDSDSTPLFGEASSGSTGSVTGVGGGGGNGGGTTSNGGGGGTSTGSGGGGGMGGAVVTPPPFDWMGIVGTGQSLSVGFTGTPLVSTTQPYNNLKLLDSGPDPKYDGVEDVYSLVPLVAPIRPMIPGYPAYVYPNNIVGETPNESMGNQLSKTAGDLGGFAYDSVHSVVGMSGQSITVIEKGGSGNSYAATLNEANAIKALADAAGKTFGYAAIILTHGETDWGDPTYADQIRQLWVDYNADLRAITGQNSMIPLLLTQQGTFPSSAGIQSQSTLAQWKLGVDYPGEILCVGPKYQYAYYPDHVHFDGVNYRRLGEKYAEVLARVALLGEAWKPLQPRSAARAGATITVELDVPDPPLAWEETISPPHQDGFTEWANGRGFEVEDESGPLTIASVTLLASSVEITLEAVPTGQDLVVRYAMTQDVDGYTGGTDDARRGQLRDSDPFVGLDQETLDCGTTGGSALITAVTGAAFARRTVGDVVSGPGVPADTVVIAKASDDALTLSQAVSGPGGPAALSFHHDQRNYCVQFEIPVP
jgi:hypothetical protein